MNQTANNLIEAKLSRSRLRFQLTIGAAVVLISFFYGLGSGLSKKAAIAHARPSGPQQFIDPTGLKIPRRMGLPQGIKVSPVGRDVMINNRPADVLSFVSDRDIESLTEELRAIWRKRGLIEAGRASDRRGVAVGVDPVSGTRYSATIWAVPPSIRKAVAGGMPVQGMLVAVDQQENSAADDAGANSVSTDAVNQGEVPGVPTRPGGHGGAVFSSNDPDGRSFSGVYTNPGSIGDNLAFYREALALQGWSEENVNFLPAEEFGAKGMGDVTFQKENQELSLVFAPSASGDDPQEKTTIMVNLMPRQGVVR